MQRIKTLIEASDGSGRIVGVNIKRLNECPFFQINNPLSGVLLNTSNGNAIDMLANSPSTPAILAVSKDGPIMVHALGIERTGACTAFFQLQDGRGTTAMMNAAINAATIFGNNGQPLYLPEALYLDEGRALVATFTDISGSANSARPVLFSAKYTEIQYDPDMVRMKERMGARQYLTMPYMYTFKPDYVSGVPGGMTQLAGGATDYQEINIADNHYFELIAISATATGEFALDIVEAETGDSIIDAPQGLNYALSSRVICGDANFPFKFHEPILFNPSGKLMLTITDLSGATNNVAVTLIGRAIAVSMNPVM